MAINTAILVFKKITNTKQTFNIARMTAHYTFSKLPLHRDTESPNTNQYHRFKSNG